ncbi:MAG: hypothetical protein K0U12_03325 [Gammaproteobacteria bacterium]|nr:hypothetical protein [Gammaproteobacteria bacterium]
MPLNLLRWQNAALKKLLQQFGLMLLLGIAVIASITGFIVYLYSDAFNHQQQRNQFLRLELAKLNSTKPVVPSPALIKLNKALHRQQIYLAAIANLETLLPSQIKLIQLKIQGDKIDLFGSSNASHYVTQLNQALSRQKLYCHNKIIYLSASSENNSHVEFQIQAELVTLKS